MICPTATPIYRLLHVDSLHTCLQRRALHAPNHTTDDGLPYKPIHNVDIQQQRKVIRIPCGPQGVIHDYVAFYFGPRSPMLYQLHTGWVAGYTEGQTPIIYLVTTAQAIRNIGVGFVFSDGHGIATFTKWFDNLNDLDKVDWNAVYAKQWKDTVDDMDRQRRKQAEFLVYRQCDWSLIDEIGVLDDRMKLKVKNILSAFGSEMDRPAHVKPGWYY